MKKNKNSASKQILRGKEGFEEYYKNLYCDRWETLKSALLKEPVYAKFQIQNCKEYFLDPASVFAASLIPSENAETYLDLCAAPGGKTLILASKMEENATLVSNERSNQRKIRLAQVIQNCLPESIQNRIKISCSDGKKWCLTQTECYDRILLDAPCSSERHVLNDEKYLNEWSPSRIKSLAMEQWALLSSAYRLLVPGGFLLYSTCALCPEENDKIILRLLKKFSNAEIIFDLEELNVSEQIKNNIQMPFIPTPEKTESGFHILPDKNSGAGPIWFSLIKKCE